MGTRYLLALFLILLVLGFGECVWQGRRIYGRGMYPKHLPITVLVWPWPCAPLLLPCPLALCCRPISSPNSLSPAEVQGAPTPQQDEAASPTLFSQMQESLLGYWDSAKNAAQDLYRKTYLPSMDEKIRYHPTPSPDTRSPSPSPFSLRLGV